MFPLKDVLDDLLSEPVIAWLCAQALYIGQPLLAVFVSENQIRRWTAQLTDEDSILPGRGPESNSG
jgi:hypothetical protein